MAPPLTADQKKIIEKIIFKDKMFAGRDILYKYLQKNHPNAKISRRQVMDFLKTTEVHQLYRPKRKTKHISSTIINKKNDASRINQVIGIDLIDMTNYESKGFKWIFTGIDMFSRKSYVVKMKNKTGPSVLAGFKQLLTKIKKSNHGQLPKSIRSDNDASFTSDEFKKYIKKIKIRHVFSNAHTPASNGMIERFNGKLKRNLKMIRTQDDDENWTDYLDQVNNNMNDSIHRIIGMTPNQLHNSDEKTEEKGASNIKKHIPKTPLEIDEFKIGEFVRVKQGDADHYNFSRQIYQIYKVYKARKVHSRTAYYVQNLETKEKESKKYYNQDLQRVKLPSIKVKEPEMFEISKIQDVSVKYKRKWLLVKYKQHTLPRWTPYEDIEKDAPKLLRAFEKKYNVKWTRSGVRLNRKILPPHRKAFVPKN